MVLGFRSRCGCRSSVDEQVHIPADVKSPDRVLRDSLIASYCNVPCWSQGEVGEGEGSGEAPPSEDKSGPESHDSSS